MIKDCDIKKVLDILENAYPDAECALNHRNTFELITAVALSAQTTDKRVNIVTPDLFDRYPNSAALAKADPTDVEDIIKTIGMYRTKSKNIIAMADVLTKEYSGEVPCDYEKLIALPGVGRKTANVVLSVGFGVPRIAVDTHVFRVANRMGLTDEKDVLKTELSLMERIPRKRWSRTHHSLIFHGRNCCDARKPQCDDCPVAHYCCYIK